MSDVKCSKWTYDMTVTSMSADVAEASTMVIGAPRYKTTRSVVRVQLEGEGDTRAELTVAHHDAPVIGDRFTVQITRQ